MNMKLSEDDACAVDLLLDQVETTGSVMSESGVFTLSDGQTMAKRLQAAEAILKLLDALPGDQPPPDLLTRTLERVRLHGAVTAQPVQGHQAGLGQNQNPV